MTSEVPEIPDYATYQFSKELCLRFTHFSVEKYFLNNHHASFELSRDANLREIVQATKDIDAINRLYEKWDVRDGFILNIDLDEATCYIMKLDGKNKIYRYQGTSTNDQVTIVKVRVDDLLPEMVHIFGFLRFLIEKKRSE